MSDVDYHAKVGEVLMLLKDGLSPFVEGVFALKIPAGVSWTSVLERKDALAGRRGGVYSPKDLSLMLRAMTERLGELGYPFDQALPRQGQTYASELRDIRNQWAHNQDFTAQTAYRAADSAELLLRSVDATEAADQVASVKSSVLPERAVVAVPEPEGTVETENGGSAVSDPLPPELTTENIHVNPSVVSAEIAITSHPVLSYAMAHCQTPVVDEITITNLGAERRGASVEIDVVSAEGSLGGPKVLLVDLGEGQPTTLRPGDLVLDPARMLAIDNERPGLIRVTVRDSDGAAIAEESSNVRVLAHNQWVMNPIELGLELLAAHVQPHAASIAPILTEASDLLKTRTGNSSLNGYQSDNPDRVDATVEAIWEAMRSRDIRYAEPPASWGLNGQKVRTPAEVIDGRLGTCLDTTVTLAAALEQAGINSTLWLLEGHIFLGYWRIDSSLGSVSVTDISDAVNLVDLKQIGLIETTAVTGGNDSLTFDEARRLPHTRQLAGGLEKFFGIVDMREARQSRIFPLASRSVDGNGEVTVTVYQAGASATIEPYYADPSTGGASEAAATAPRRVEQWKNALLDLSLRNKLINYTDRSGFRLAVPTVAIGRMEDSINAGASVTLLPSDAVSQIEQQRGIRFGRDLPEQARELLLADKKSAYVDITGAAYTSKLRYLASKAKTIAEETGANNLYLAFGMLHWQFNDRELRSPLVLVPVTMSTTSRGTSYRLTIDDASASTPNYCLLEKLRVSFGLDVPGLANPAEDASGIDLPAAFRAMREAIVQAGLPFRVEESVDLSILQFSKFPLWKDLDENWEALSQNSLVSHLINSPLEPYADPVAHSSVIDLDDLNGSVPVPADSSQLEAVAEAVAGRTFVLEGPPGTGKSQTITNLLARSLAAGKRVLFVAEKRAALDVVKKRLESVGLGEFSLDLHDKGARPTAVRAQIKAALDLRVQPDQAALQANREAAESSRRSLARYADRLHETNAAGLSLYSARTQVLASDADVTPLTVPAELVANSSPEAFTAIRDVLRSLPEYADLAHPTPEHPWAFLNESANNRVDAQNVQTAARAFDQALAAAVAAGFNLEVLNRATSPQQIETWRDVSGAPRYPLTVLDTLARPDWKSYMSSLEGEADAIGRGTPLWRDSIRPTALLKNVPSIHAAALAADQAGFFGRKKKRQAVLAMFADELTVDAGSVPLKTLSTLTESLAASHTDTERLRAKIQQLPLALVGPQWNPFVEDDAAALKQSFAWIKWLGATASRNADPHVADLRAYYSSTAVGFGQNELATLGAAWQSLVSAAGIAADSPRYATWIGDAGFLVRWSATRTARNVASVQPVVLERWLALTRHLEPLLSHGLTDAHTDLLTGRVQADDAALAFDKGVAVASITEREDTTSLSSFDIAAHNKTIGRFSLSADAVRSELPRAIPADVLSLRRFSSTSASGQIGGLRRQLDRQRGGLSVRKLLEEYGELITQVMPCTLMSPESVARFFAAKPDLFDIVVFDEASQIRVADAVGAMGRATSVVVVGDSKQMPPTSFAEVGSVDDEVEPEPGVVVDEESILTECVQALVPSKWLSWHYRSQDESLIAFSNHHYYESRLSSFPAPLHGGQAASLNGYGVSLVRVDGHFERSGKGKNLRTNRVEADAIVDDIVRRFAASPDVSPSVGVITFNVQQRTLIENLLRDCSDARIAQALDEPDGLFVKNLENVQGDERDSILFSIAFSANDSGVVPLNFGPLSRAGGERRLNVAITRARRQVVLYASFDPEALRSQDTGATGIKHLKAYLELAARGVEASTGHQQRQSVVDRHRDEIAAELRFAGFAVRTDVGLSDFRVDLSIADAAEPDKPLVAVLLDGPNWRARRTVADRDGLPVSVLQGLMRWPGVERVWLPEWLHGREETVARLTDAVANAKLGRGAPASDGVGGDDDADPGEAHLATRSDLETEFAKSISSKVASGGSRGRSDSGPIASSPTSAPTGEFVQEFSEWSPGFIGSVSVLDALPRRQAVAQVRAAIETAVRTEGPIHRGRLAKLVAGAFGLDRVNQSRASSILQCVPTDLAARKNDSFIWPADIDPADWHAVRRPSPGTNRQLDHVPLEEIANAMRIAAEQSGGMGEAELKRNALAIFGGRRLTESINARLGEALALALESGRIERSGYGVYVGAPRRN